MRHPHFPKYIPILLLTGLTSPAFCQGLTPAAGEMRIEGSIRSLDSAHNSFVLSVTQITMSGGKPTFLNPSRPKTVIILPASALQVRGSDKALLFGDLKTGSSASVVGKDTGPGTPLSAREVETANREYLQTST